jgi:C4-dicarboxylate-binding protein DctP
MARRWSVRLVVGLIFSVFLSLALAGVVAAQTKGASDGKRKIIKLRVVSGHPPAAFWTYQVQKFLVPELKKQVLAQTKDYQLDIEELYGGSIAKLGEELEALESGIADIGTVCIVFEMSKLHPHQFAWWFPFGSTDLIQVTKAANLTYQKFPVLDQVFTKYKQKRLALAGTGSYHFVTRFPIARLEDMKGKRMAHGGPMIPWLEAIGSVGVQSRLNEAYTALQTGVYDGWAMEPNSTVGFKLYEPAPYYTLAGLGAGFPTIVNISLNAWNKLPKEVQEIVVKVGKEYEKVNAEASMADHNEKIEFMRKNGTKISTLAESERARFAKAMDGALVADKMAKESDKMGFPGSEMSRFYIKTLSELGYKWPVVPTIK